MKTTTLLPLIALLPVSLSAAQQDTPTPPQPPAAEQPAAAPLTPEERALFTRWSNGHRHIRTPQWWNEEPRSLFSSRLIMEDGRPQAYEQRIATLSEDGMTLTLLTRRAAIGKSGFTYAKEVRRAMALNGLNNGAAAPYTFVRELGTPGEVEVEHWQLDPATRDLLRVTRTRFNLYDPNSMEQAPEQVAWQKPAPYSEAGAPLVRIEQRHDPKDVDHWPDPAQNPKYAVSPDGKHMVYAFENATGAIQYYFDIFTREGDAWVHEPQAGSICTRWCGLDYELTDAGIIGIIVDDELELALTTFIPYTTGGSMNYRTTYEDRFTPLVEAAANGDEATVRALLTCPKVDPGAVNCRGIEAFMVANTPEIILLIRERQGFGYDYGKALDAAISKWKAFDGKYDSLTNGYPENYVRDLLRAKQSYLAERRERIVTKLTLPSIEEENLFRGWDMWRHSETPQWDAKRRTMYTTKLRTDADGRQVYSEAVQQLSEDGMQLTLIFRRGVCGTAGFIYEKDVLHAKEPYIFDLNKGVQVIWRLAPDNDLQEVVMRRVDPGASEENDRQLWKKPEPYSAEKAPLVIFRNLVDGKLMESAEPDPTGDPRYATSPDGKHLVHAHENGSGAWSYIFTIYTREGDAWVQEPQQKFFGSRACPLDFSLTNEGIVGILQDEELQLYLPIFIPYTGSENGLWYRGERAEYAYPLHDAAREGQVEVVRALLTSLLIDPCELNSRGEDATMVTDNEAIIALIRAAQGPDYDYGKALDAAIKHWNLVAEGKRSDPRAIAPAEAIEILLRAKEAWIAEQVNRRALPSNRLFQVQQEIQQHSLQQQRALQQQLNSAAKAAFKQTPEQLEKARAIWEGKQSVSLEDLPALARYAKAELRAAAAPRFLVSPARDVIICCLLISEEQRQWRFAAFHREGYRFVCKNHLDFFTHANIVEKETSFSSRYATLHFSLRSAPSAPSAEVSLRLNYDTPWDVSYFLPTPGEAFLFRYDPTSRFIHAVRQMDTATIEEYLSHGYSLNARMPEEKHENGEASLFLSVLRWCVDEELTRALPLLLQKYGADVHARGNSGIGVLHTAQYLCSKPATVKMLLAAGADPNLADDSGETPLMLAAGRADAATAELLLAAGADATARAKDGSTTMHALFRLHLSPFELEHRQPQPSSQAFCERILATARLLLAAGADINAADKDGNTPIFTLLRNLRYFSEDSLLTLLPELAKLGADLHHKNAAGNTIADLLPERYSRAGQLLASLLADQKKND